ncbi:hypothetical protein Hypma_012941 [Hypsizygus marmoreus]|uniref:Uncharacterized protein n=1 Tax=Hypsizygus marmoreus TaxID=39966 RepID=A0A369JKK2_HYPMA|nr:hypothetical protein Hypma_012941 [Hypsizygus marmoreus]
MASKPASKPAPGRGRTVVSKPLLTSSTASTRAKQAPSVSTNKSVSAEKKPPRTLSSSSTTSLKSSDRTPVVGKSAKPRAPPTNDVKPKIDTEKPRPPAKLVADPISASSLNTKPPLLPTLPPPMEEKAPAPTSDSLQVAAQLYPWLYMTSTLEACFKTAEETANKGLEARSQQLAEEEQDISDQRIRFEAEKAADFYDELAADDFAKEAPSIMQTFLSHGDACTRVEAEALQLATQGASEPGDDAPLQIYNDMLENLEDLHAEAVELETSILKLTSSKSDQPDVDSDSMAHSQILGVFSACLPVLHARISNLIMAQELIDGAQENLSISLRMESLGLLD